MTLVLSKQDVRDLVDMAALVDAVEGAMIEVSRGTAINPNRLRLFMPERQAMMACMPGYLGDLDVLGAKIVSSSSRKPSPGKPRPMSALTVLSNTSGQFLAVMCGTELGALRTGAASAVAIRHLAVTQASVMAVIGCGVQGRAELAGALAVRKLSSVYAFDIDRDVAERFRRDMETRHGIVVAVTESAEAAVEHADIVAIATTSATPVVADSAIRPGTHVNAVGAHTPSTRELGSDILARARVFAESRSALFGEAGDILIPMQEGHFERSHIVAEIGEVAAGTTRGRLSAEDITIFKSTGIAVQDVVAARLIYERALAKGIGVDVEL